MTVTWAKELARYKILVAGIAPGDAHGCEHQIRDKIVSGIPLKRFAKLEEIARAALFVLQNDYDDGRVLEIDDGLRLWAAGTFAAFCPVSTRVRGQEAWISVRSSSVNPVRAAIGTFDGSLVP